MAGRLDGKVALISGGARGLGAEHVRLFAEHGASVVFGDVRDELGSQLETDAREADLPVTYIHLDVSSPTDWKDAVEQVVERHGRLTTLVNNAAIYSAAGIEQTSAELWSDIVSVNLGGQWHGLREALPALSDAGKSAGASVVNICSIYGNIGSTGSSAYHASKGGVRLLTKATAVEYAPRGVRVNCVHPGQIDTEFGGTDFTEEEKERQLDRIPLSRGAAPIEIAYASLFLASDEASYVTGAELMVDGGWSAS